MLDIHKLACRQSKVLMQENVSVSYVPYCCNCHTGVTGYMVKQ